MAATGYTPISLYYSTTASAVPTSGNLANGELAINITDGKLYYKNNSGTVTLLATAGTTSSQWTTTGSDIYYNTGSVGIGTSTLISKLTVQGASDIRITVNESGSSVRTDLVSQTTQGLVGTQSNHPFDIFTNGTTRARFDTSGNLGLGVTPSAWATFTALQVGNGSIYSTAGSSNNSAFGSNVYFDGTNYKYIASNFATSYVQQNGVHKWNTAASGTAGNAITFTQAMTLDASGNLGVGTTSPATKIDAVSSANGINTIRVSTTNTDTSTFAAQAYFRVDAGGNHIGGLKSTVRNLSGLSTPSLFLTTAGAYPIAFGVNDSSTPSMIVTTSGGLSVGTAADPGAGAIYATGNITAYYSDDRLKTRLGNIENALDKVDSLSGFYYEANETAQALGYKVKREVGVSAQSVQAVLPEIVSPAPIDQQYLTVDYERLAPLLIEAVKELRAEVKALKGV